jgi:hypothetical protein
VVIPVLYRYFEGRERNAPPGAQVESGELVVH